MANGFQADSCSMTAQTSAGSSDSAAACLRARAMSWGGGLMGGFCRAGRWSGGVGGSSGVIRCPCATWRSAEYMRSPEVEEMKEVEEIKESRSSILGNQVQMQNPHPEKSKGAAPKRKPCHGGRGGARERFVSGRVWLLTMGLR